MNFIILDLWICKWFSVLVWLFHKGIPKTRRGEIWQLICEQQKLIGCVVSAKIPEHEPYKELLKQLTIHQHAILIDLGESR